MLRKFTLGTRCFTNYRIHKDRFSCDVSLYASGKYKLPAKKSHTQLMLDSEEKDLPLPKQRASSYYKKKFDTDEINV